MFYISIILCNYQKQRQKQQSYFSYHNDIFHNISHNSSDINQNISHNSSDINHNISLNSNDIFHN